MTPLLAAALAVALLPAAASATPAAAEERWPRFDRYVARFVSPDGRVIDPAAGAITTSEGQSYALFFALVQDDRALFSRLLRWTSDNLAAGRLGERLPAYLWGRRADGSWGVLDENSAADSDLFIGYVLIEAGRLWQDDGLDRMGRALLAQVVAREVVHLPGLGAMLLPAPRGFVHGSWVRLNPSYLPLPLLRGLETDRVAGPWRAIARNTARIIEARAHHGFIADWIAYQPRRGFFTDPIKGAIGSYDAIRVYLWLGLTDPGDPLRAALARRLDGPFRYFQLHGKVPERIDTRRPSPNARSGPVGFCAVLLPRAVASGDAAASSRLAGEIARRLADPSHPPGYYDENLLLFSEGFIEHRYRFSRDGRLHPAWERSSHRQARSQSP